MGKSGHQYGQNFYTNIRIFLAKLPKQLILGPMELGQYFEDEVLSRFWSWNIYLRLYVLIWISISFWINLYFYTKCIIWSGKYPDRKMLQFNTSSTPSPGGRRMGWWCMPTSMGAELEFVHDDSTAFPLSIFWQNNFCQWEGGTPNTFEEKNSYFW